MDQSIGISNEDVRIMESRLEKARTLSKAIAAQVAARGDDATLLHVTASLLADVAVDHVEARIQLLKIVAALNKAEIKIPSLESLASK